MPSRHCWIAILPVRRGRPRPRETGFPLRQQRNRRSPPEPAGFAGRPRGSRSGDFSHSGWPDAVERKFAL